MMNLIQMGAAHRPPARERDEMGSCYLHTERPIEGICLRCNAGICGQCICHFRGQPYCPHCILGLQQQQKARRQTLTWLALTLCLGLLMGGLMFWMALSAPPPTPTVSQEAPATDANTPDHATTTPR